MTERTAIAHRLVTGWATDFSSVARTLPWPDISIDDALIADVAHAAARAREAGYTGMILWGLAVGRGWQPDLAATLTEERRRQARAMIASVRAQGLSVYFGMGLNSWGFEDVIQACPEVDGGSPTVMCASLPQSWERMRGVLDYVMQQFDPDGVSMQSSDQGRCPCDDCQAMTPMQYQAEVNDQAAGYLKSRWPAKRISISTWGMDLGDPAELPHVQRMTRHADVLNDFNNSAARRGRAHRRTLIAALGCAYGTEQGFWFDVPPYWPRDKWFMPFSVRNVPYWRDLAADGGDQIERYISPLVSPAAEVGFLFDGWMMQDLARDPEATLAEALARVFRPADPASLDGLHRIWRDTEDAFLAMIPAPGEFREIHSNRIHYTYAHPSAHLAARPEYLLRRPAAKLRVWRAQLALALEQAQALLPAVTHDKGAMLVRCISGALADTDWVLGHRPAT